MCYGNSLRNVTAIGQDICSYSVYPHINILCTIQPQFYGQTGVQGVCLHERVSGMADKQFGTGRDVVLWPI